MSAASEITRRAKSNLAFAFHILSPDRREDMMVFYAFCRTIDDLADDPGLTRENRARSLDDWENGILHGFDSPNELQQEVLSLRDRQNIPNNLLVAIIDGCRMDLHPQRFATWEDLSDYIWKVACAVGLVSIRIFGFTDPECERYAVALGRALQLTNILRDISEDLSNGGRIYLPVTDLARFDYSETDLIAQVHDERFIAMMNYEAARAEAFFEEAANALPAIDRRSMLPARIMGEIYRLLLNKMRDDGFHLFEKRYHISKARKLMILFKHLMLR